MVPKGICFAEIYFLEIYQARLKFAKISSIEVNKLLLDLYIAQILDYPPKNSQNTQICQCILDMIVVLFLLFKNSFRTMPINYFSQMTGVLADGLWSASGKSSKGSRDASQGSQSSTSHMSAGLKGLGKGVFGGLTSIITEPLEGASKKGVGVRKCCVPHVGHSYVKVDLHFNIVYNYHLNIWKSHLKLKAWFQC